MANLPETRQSLLLRLKERNDDAWVEFLAIYEKSIIEFARRKGLQQADALDVTQEILTVVEDKIQTWNTSPSKGSFRGWLFRVARNIAVDAIVANGKSPRSGGSAWQGQLNEIANSEQDTVEFLADYRQQLLEWAVERVRPRVSENSWQAFWMTT
ncbi:MAG: sigma-70 family RNA polymerase sigma factor, partial [Planctomycetota bacterium]